MEKEVRPQKRMQTKDIPLLLKMPFAYGMTLLYVLIAGLWVYFSDRLIMLISHTPEQLMRLSTGKGWFFVFFTALLLFFTLSRFISKIRLTQRQIRNGAERHRITLNAIGDAVIATDVQGRVEMLNPAAEALTGWRHENACGRPMQEVFHIINEETREKAENPVFKVLREGLVVGLANHTLLIAKDGTERPIADSAAPIRDAQGKITGVVLVFRDQSEERRTQRLIQARVSVLEYASTHTVDAVLTKTLDEIGALVNSPIGFYHFVSEDQQSLSLQQWSTRTLKEFCRTEGRGMHYGVDDAGVWADAVREGKPVVHNDYASLRHKKGMPEGHPGVVREMVVPLLKDEKVVAVLGMGNKPMDYTDKDVETVAYLADVTWHLIEHRRTRAALTESEQKWRNILVHTPQIGISLDPQGRIAFANKHFLQTTGWSEEEVLGKDWFELFIPAEKREEIRQFFRSTMSEKNGLGLSSYENEIVTRTGDRRNVAWSNVLTRDVHGTILDVTSLGVDLTERKQTEREMVRQKQLFETMFNTITDGVVITNTHREIQLANRGMESTFGYRPKELLGKSTEMLYADADHYREAGSDVYDKNAKNPGMLYVTRYRDKSGKVFLGETFGAKLFDENNRWIGNLGIMRDITERKDAEEELRRRENLLQRVFEILPIGLWFADKNGTLLRGNPMGVKIWGAEPQVPISEYGIFKAWRLPSRQAIEPQEWALAKTIRNGETIVDELLEIESFDGKRKTILNYSAPVLDDQGGIDGAIVVNLDISDRKALEDQLMQAQKMESVGRLAGGVAHDFNNMLSVIIGNTELALDDVAAGDPVRHALEEVLNAAGRSADITRQLLAFARKQTIAPKVLDLNKTIKSMLKMLRRLIGEDIDLTWLPAKTVCPVRMDPSQIDQILANLCINSRDAITDVGKITIETGTATFDEAYCANHVGFVPGDFVLIAVSDNGCGMDRRTLDNLFEPFFTTKDVDKGTGLGLATVYGIIKQNRGFINVYSEPGQGTVFKIYLPRHETAAKKSKEEPATPDARGGETILLVEDDPSILEMVKTMLERLGYTVLTADKPGEAIHLAREHSEEIHLLITDVVMPELNGRDLAKNLLSFHPNLKRLFMSGYTANVIAHHGVLDEGVQFIQKPFGIQDLAVKVRQVLKN